MDVHQNINLIDQLMANEQKNKRWAILATMLFILMACGFILFAWLWNQEKEGYQNEIEKQANLLKQVNSTRKREIQLYQEKDSILAEWMKNNPRVSSQLPATLVPETESAEKDLPMDVAESKNTSIAPAPAPAPLVEAPDYPTGAGSAASPPPEKEKPYRIFIQYMPEQQKLAGQIREKLSATRIGKVPPAEKMEFSFATEIRYFSESDRAQAEWVAKVIGETGPQLPVRFVSLSGVRPRLIEIWIGQ